MKKEKLMCVYKIDTAPYFAISNVYELKDDKVIIECTGKKLKCVDPIVICPFDAEKFFRFSAMIASYFKKTSTLKSLFERQFYETFNIDPVELQGD